MEPIITLVGVVNTSNWRLLVLYTTPNGLESWWSQPAPYSDLVRFKQVDRIVRETDRLVVYTRYNNQLTLNKV